MTYYPLWSVCCGALALLDHGYGRVPALREVRPEVRGAAMTSGQLVGIALVIWGLAVLAVLILCRSAKQDQEVYRTSHRVFPVRQRVRGEHPSPAREGGCIMPGER